MRLSRDRWLALLLITLAASLALPQLDLRLLIRGHSFAIGSLLAILLAVTAWYLCWASDRRTVIHDPTLGWWWYLWSSLNAYHIQAATYLGLGLSLLGQPTLSGLFILLADSLGASQALLLTRGVGYLFMGFSWLLLVSRLGPLEFILLQLPFGLYTLTSLVLAATGLVSFNVIIIYQAFLAQGMLAILGHYVNKTISSRLTSLRLEVKALNHELRGLADGSTDAAE